MGDEQPTNLIDRPGRELERQVVTAPDGPALAYTEVGKGRPVVLIHGTLTALEDMAISLFDALQPNCRAIAFDRPGFGRSEVRRFIDAGMWAQAGRLQQAMDHLKIERPVLVGHSMGATVAIAMAIARPDAIAGVVAVAPLALPEPRLEHVLFAPRAAPFTGDLLSVGAGMTGDRAMLPLIWRAMYLPQTMPQAVEDEFPFALAGRSESTARVGEDSIAAMPDLSRLLATCAGCPVSIRIFGGDRDIVVRNETNGRFLAQLMPNATFVGLPGFGHMAHHFVPGEIAKTAINLLSQNQ